MIDEKSGPFIIGFNGPPRSGKDAIATALMDLLDKEGVTSLPVHRQALAATMRDGAAAILGMNLTDKQYGEIKDQPLAVLGGGSFRKFMIDMSEVFVKGVYGRDFWSRLLYTRNNIWWDKLPSILIVTDIGFKEEVEFFCNHSRLYLNVRLDRPDTNFNLDSRGYVAAQTYGGRDFALTNDGTIEEAAQEVARIMYKFGVPVF
jgi:hypothetical protein